MCRNEYMRPSCLACGHEDEHEHQHALTNYLGHSLVYHIHKGETKKPRRRGYGTSAVFVGSSTSLRGTAKRLKSHHRNVVGMVPGGDFVTEVTSLTRYFSRRSLREQCGRNKTRVAAGLFVPYATLPPLCLMCMLHRCVASCSS